MSLIYITFPVNVYDKTSKANVLKCCFGRRLALLPSIFNQRSRIPIYVKYLHCNVLIQVARFIRVYMRLIFDLNLLKILGKKFLFR